MPIIIILILGALGWLMYAGWRKNERRRESLSARFGAQVADLIMRGKVWQGATREMLLESHGAPEDVKEHVLKTKTKHTFCYKRIAKNRFALRVHLEDGVVVGWDV
jgi:hypothetical protein